MHCGVLLLCSPALPTHMRSRPQHVQLGGCFCTYIFVLWHERYICQFLCDGLKQKQSVLSWSSEKASCLPVYTLFHLWAMDNLWKMYILIIIISHSDIQFENKGAKPGKPFDLSDTLFGFAVFTFSQIHWEGFSVLQEMSKISTDS